MQGGGESEARYMRRKVKAGLIEADHADCAIVVHYEVEATAEPEPDPDPEPEPEPESQPQPQPQPQPPNLPTGH